MLYLLFGYYYPSVLNLSSLYAFLTIYLTLPQIRVWDIVTGTDHAGKNEMRAELRHSMKEHKNFVSEIIMRSNDKEFASAGGDGTTIIWDLV